jgi:hypothetical protein
MGELEKIITAVFQKEGKDALTAREIALSISMGRHWFKLQEAKQIVDMAQAANLLKDDGGNLKPAFDMLAVHLDLDYAPTRDILAPKPTEDVFMAIVDAIVSATSLEKRQVISHINKKKSVLGVSIDVAALLVAKSYDVDVSRFIDGVEKKVLEG